MTHGFDDDYWQAHWREQGARTGAASMPPNPHLVDEIGALPAGTALDAGCGEGAEARWLADQGWQVTAADISAEVLARAARSAGASRSVRWVEADLSVWTPDRQFDLVTTHYAHSVLPQLEFYRRLSAWVAPGGTLLIVGHLDRPGRGHAHGHGHGHGHGVGQGHDPVAEPPAEALVTAVRTAGVLDPHVWEVVTADERVRTVAGRGGVSRELHDVVVRAVRRS